MPNVILFRLPFRPSLYHRVHQVTLKIIRATFWYIKYTIEKKKARLTRSQDVVLTRRSDDTL